MTFNQDKASEKFRKYVIEIKFRGISHFTLWGTDSSGCDRLLLDLKNRLLTFFSISELVQFIKRDRSLPLGFENAQLWAAEYTPSTPYYSYDIDDIKRIISDPNFDPTKPNAGDAFQMINFLNLFGDYAYQTNETKAMSLVENKSIKSFFDLSYNNFFWKSDGKVKSIEPIMDKNQFVRTYDSMVHHFLMLLS